MHGLSGTASRFPSQWHKVNALLLTYYERLQQLPVMSVLGYYTSFRHRNIKIFFLQWVGNGDVKSGRREASMVMLNSNVARLDIGALNLVLLLSHNGTETSSSCRVAKNVANAVVTKHKRGSVVAAKRMITIDIHLALTNDTATCNSSTWRR